MARRTSTILYVLVGAFVLLTPAGVFAQSGIAGVVKDTTGAVLPGVTVEAASPALIEKVRTVVTDGQGQYKIVDLRPGVYTVTFSLVGFSTIKREGIELTTNFTAQVNSEMRVGALEETVTVSGASPVVDVQNVVQRSVVGKDVMAALPSGRSEFNFAVLIPGIMITSTSRPSGQDVGGQGATGPNKVSIHGGRNDDTNELISGIPANTINQWQTSGNQADTGSLQEIAFELGANSADNPTGGIRINWIPKDGGNRFVGSFFSAYTNHSLQRNNITDELRARGLSLVNSMDHTWDANPSFGGPIKQDRLWFYMSTRSWGSYERAANMWYNATPNAFVYTPDLSRPAIGDVWMVTASLRPTWQVTPKHKISAFLFDMGRCYCHNNVKATVAPEAAGRGRHAINHLEQVFWSAPLTNRLLLEAGAQNYHFEQVSERQPGVTPDTLSVQELSTGLMFRAAPSFGRHNDWTYNEKAALSYVTGSHAFKVGFFLQHGERQVTRSVNGDLNLQLLNGVPRSVTVNTTPWYGQWDRLNANLGLYAQDQWTVKRLTLNLGMLFNYFNASVPEQHLPPVRFVGPRDFAAVPDVPNWKDLLPRLGAAYDLFGTGKTALKVALSRYVQGDTLTFAAANNPITTSVNTVTRTWNDLNGNFNPDCNFLNPAANGECGVISNVNFGKPNVVTRYADDVRTGFGHRPSSWETSASVQHELLPQVSINTGYFRRWYENFTVTDNLAVTPANYDPYCITAPVDPRLPGGGGNQICGLYDINPAKFGQVNNLVTFASNFGKQTEVYNGIDFNMNARLPHKVLLSGGLSSGTSHQLTQVGEVSAVTDRCFVVDSPQALRFCHVQAPWLTQYKGFGTVGLPWDLQAAATFQSMPGPPITATYVVPNEQIRGSLGRDLAAGPRGTATVDLVQPGTMYEERLYQVDLRLSKIFRVGRARIQGNLDLYNAFNTSPVLLSNTQYGPAWLSPSYILSGRMFKFGGQIDF